ncbi:hypothetical protein [Halorhabdus sp. CBA1104]|nr:hypothetical protein [Halorhabdus sp. CBA1104]
MSQRALQRGEIAIAPGRCACGRQAAGYDAMREAPVCPVCARSLGGDVDG